MLDCPDILISLAPAYTKAILEGRKTVELRRRRVRVERGTRVWLYSKSPSAKVEASALVEHIYEAAPKGIWSEYSADVGISRAEFDEYFRGCSTGYAIVLRGVQAITPALDLATVRKGLSGFHPPQFFKRLAPDEVKLLVQASGIKSPEKRIRHSGLSR